MGTKNTSVVLTDHFVRFAEQQVRNGRYGSTSEVMRAGLRLLEEREGKIASVRIALEQGEASGVEQGFNFDAFIAAVDEPPR